MITKCTKKHHSLLMDYLSQDKVSNLFIIGDIDNYGFDNDFQNIYIDEEDNKIVTVYLTYHDSLVISSYDNVVDNAFVDHLINEYDITIISGLKAVIDQIDIEDKHQEDCYFAKMIKPNDMVDTSMVRYAKYDQLPLIAKTHKMIFNNDKDELPSLQLSFSSKSGRQAAIFMDNQAVSVASSTAECDGLAMVVGVGTLPEYRNHQYASMCITKLSNDLLAEGKIPCLFYSNPSAGRIYKALGYQDIGFWSLIRL